MTKRFASALSQLITIVREPPPLSTHQPYPKLRNFILDLMAEGRRKNTIHLPFEADLGPVRHHLGQYKAATGERISLTTYFAKSLACVIDEDKAMHAVRHGKSRLLIFDEVDLAIMVERDIDGGLMPVNCIVRAANRKNSAEIHRELQAAKIAPLGESGPLSALEKQFFALPTPLRKIAWFFIRRDPILFKQLAGTVGITSLGMHTGGPVIGIPITPMTLTLCIGSTGKKLVLENGCPVEREYIQLNLSANHDVIDGAPLMRFIERFRKVLEEGRALDILQPAEEYPKKYA
jgi:pyruvate/2-oxoglutarate dehydrogenase complex dihydrolipoamide acyltransferase (E2) component